MSEKPEAGSQEGLTVRYARYRKMLCRDTPELDGVLRRGAMERTSFASLARHFAVILLDAFGVLNVGREAIPGSVQAVAALRAQKRSFRVVSNNASQSPQGILRRLGEMGFVLEEGELLSSGMVVGDYVARSRYRDRPYFLVGSRESAECYAPRPESLMVNADSSPWRLEEAEYVLMCSNRDYYGGEQERSLTRLLQQKPLPVLLANPDLVAPKGPGSLEVVAGFTAMELAERFHTPLEGIGKPFPPIFQQARQGFPGVAAERVLMVGDTLDTDILGAKAMGFASCLTLSGACVGWEGNLEALCDARGIRPDFVVSSLGS
ncbi:MAG: HAD-IIA family hydrolase [Magnetococcales bacterium]|nr:HAD-IIA family hydrolase [Magnetococcales bacterium]